MWRQLRLGGGGIGMEGTDACHDFTNLSFFRQVLSWQWLQQKYIHLTPSIFSLCFVTLHSSGILYQLRFLRRLVSPFIGLFNFNNKTFALLYSAN